MASSRISSRIPLLRRLSSAPIISNNKNTRSPSFPSLILGANKSITPIGSFAQAQAEFLQPDVASVQELQQLMKRTNTGIVAHYYMDVELQGILHAAAATTDDQDESASSIAIADSLAMGDAALRMVMAGRSNIACLGVDFMSESVQAILDYNNNNNNNTNFNHQHVPVYRLSDRKIGCSLAESAERDDYNQWLEQAAAKTNHPALHVVYINTSLETKARSNAIVPTITCTSSNVLNTILTAALQIPSVEIYYGPDTYMGENIVTMLRTIYSQWSDEEIQTKLHPHHTRASIQQLHDRMHVYPSGNCIVHHMFGNDVVSTVQKEYQDAYITAHLEVPGEMFQLAMQASMDDHPRGVVGSTSNILNFIIDKVRNPSSFGGGADNVSSSSSSSHLKFILGTEAGMVTSIVQKLQPLITGDRTVEIIFPVASDAVTIGSDSTTLPLVPGVKATEGCSTAGGCATCPFMKMNDFDALLKVLHLIEQNNETTTTSISTLQSFRPPNRLANVTIHNRPAMEWAIEPIQYMRQFGQKKALPDDLIQRVLRQSR